MTSPALLSCPFCGGEAAIRRDGLNMPYGTCSKCSARAPWTMTDRTAAEWWNRRTDSSLATSHAALRAVAVQARDYLIDHGNHASNCPFALGGAPSSECCRFGRLYANLYAALQEPAP